MIIVWLLFTDLSRFRPVYAPKDFLEVVSCLKNPNLVESLESTGFVTALPFLYIVIDMIAIQLTPFLLVIRRPYESTKSLKILNLHNPNSTPNSNPKYKHALLLECIHFRLEGNHISKSIEKMVLGANPTHIH